MSSPQISNLPLLRTRTMSTCSTELRTRTTSICSTESIHDDMSSYSSHSSETSNTFAPASKKLWYRKGYKPSGDNLSKSTESLEKKKEHKWASSPSDEKLISRLLHIPNTKTADTIIESDFDYKLEPKKGNTFYTSRCLLPDLHD